MLKPLETVASIEKEQDAQPENLKISQGKSSPTEVFLQLKADVAQNADADTQNKLGYCYYYGKGVAKNLVEAAMCYRKAAEQDDAVGQYNLGYCYYFGKGLIQNFSAAERWFWKAANQGHANGQYFLGECYYYGNGIKQDYKIAVYWYQKAAKQGHKEAQNMLKSRKLKQFL